jgi:hypothetical protein
VLPETARLFIPPAVVLCGLGSPSSWLETIALLLVPAGLFAVWELGYRVLTARSRAGVRLMPPLGDLAPRAGIANPLADLDGWRRRNAPKVQRFRHRMKWKYGSWLPWLVPQAAAGMLALLAPAPGTEKEVFRAFMGLFPVALVAVAPGIPRVFLIINRYWSVATGILAPLSVFLVLEGDMVWALGIPALAAAVGLPFLFRWFNDKAIARCPALAPECPQCTGGDWDVRQVVDPLNIRRFAAPWQLARIDTSAPAAQDEADLPEVLIAE